MLTSAVSKKLQPAATPVSKVENRSSCERHGLFGIPIIGIGACRHHSNHTLKKTFSTEISGGFIVYPKLLVWISARFNNRLLSFASMCLCVCENALESSNDL